MTTQILDFKFAGFSSCNENKRINPVQDLMFVCVHFDVKPFTVHVLAVIQLFWGIFQYTSSLKLTIVCGNTCSSLFEGT
jgi:hypothetical protein